MRVLQEFKFIVQPVLAVVDGEKIVGEQTADPVVLYGLSQVQAFIDSFDEQLKKANTQASEA